jgi:hypothetical protein
MKDEYQTAEALREKYPKTCISVKHTTRLSRRTIQGHIEITFGEDDDWDVVKITGKNRFHYADLICHKLTHPLQRYQQED